VRFLLLPLAWVYGLSTWLRNTAFSLGLLKSKGYNIPVIAVGNLNAGGSGKTPYVEYLIRLLSPEYQIATLSRGYKRKSSGFLLAGDLPDPDMLGDEPAQFARKYPDVIVAVDEKRVHGIEKLLQLDKPPDAILLDDAFQHRYVKAGFKVLITDYSLPYYHDYLLPVGRLREARRESRRADIIIVSKAPQILNPLERRLIVEKLRPRQHQTVFFTYLSYGPLKPIMATFGVQSKKNYGAILCFCGIANPDPLEEYLRRKCTDFHMITFNDHHRYSSRDLEKIIETFGTLMSRDKIIVTTEKDAVRLMIPEFFAQLEGLPIYYLPIEVQFQKTDKPTHDQTILKYVRKTESNT
jgi:tetraacyldisaccharide 4'-kinase